MNIVKYQIAKNGDAFVLVLHLFPGRDSAGAERLFVGSPVPWPVREIYGWSESTALEWLDRNGWSFVIKPETQP